LNGEAVQFEVQARRGGIVKKISREIGLRQGTV
jgi:hypothetical protein